MFVCLFEKISCDNLSTEDDNQRRALWALDSVSFPFPVISRLLSSHPLGYSCLSSSPFTCTFPNSSPLPEIVKVFAKTFTSKTQQVAPTALLHVGWLVSRLTSQRHADVCISVLPH